MISLFSSLQLLGIYCYVSRERKSVSPDHLKTEAENGKGGLEAQLCHTLFQNTDRRQCPQNFK